MAEITVRFWQAPDIPDLLEIFTASYGDSPEDVAKFHRAFLTAPEVCLLAAAAEEGRPEGRPVAAAYCLPGPELRLPQGPVSSVYLYALGCLPAWRGQGIAKQVYTAIFDEGRRQAPVSVMVPASGELLRAYNRSNRIFTPLGRSRFARMTGETARAEEALRAERIPWEEYARRREEQLAPYPHAVYPEAYYRLAAEYGNVFLRMDGALAATIPGEDRCRVAELLCDGAEPAQAAAGIAAVCPAEEYEIRTPVFFPGDGEARPFAYCLGTGEEIHGTEDFWYPFALE